MSQFSFQANSCGFYLTRSGTAKAGSWPTVVAAEAYGGKVANGQTFFIKGVNVGAKHRYVLYNVFAGVAPLAVEVPSTPGKPGEVLVYESLNVSTVAQQFTLLASATQPGVPNRVRLYSCYSGMAVSPYPPQGGQGVVVEPVNGSQAQDWYVQIAPNLRATLTAQELTNNLSTSSGSLAIHATGLNPNTYHVLRYMGVPRLALDDASDLPQDTLTPPLNLVSDAGGNLSATAIIPLLEEGQGVENPGGFTTCLLEDSSFNVAAITVISNRVFYFK